MSDEYPVCATCGASGYDLALEAAVYWFPKESRAEVIDLYDKGHYCSQCDGQVDLEWKNYYEQDKPKNIDPV